MIIMMLNFDLNSMAQEVKIRFNFALQTTMIWMSDIYNEFSYDAICHHPLYSILREEPATITKNLAKSIGKQL